MFHFDVDILYTAAGIDLVWRGPLWHSSHSLPLTSFTNRLFLEPFLPAHFIFNKLNGKGSLVDKSQPLVISLCRIRLEELRMFLENETWELCPVKSNFSIAQLHVSPNATDKTLKCSSVTYIHDWSGPTGSLFRFHICIWRWARVFLSCACFETTVIRWL